jgi:hypothetical protein
MLFRPILDDIEVSTLLYDVELSRVHIFLCYPVHGHDIQVAVTH